MKQETKELIKWIENRLKIRLLEIKEMRLLDIKENQSQSNYEEYKKDYNKAINFLDSLPEIESHLRNGGYIQDRKGTPCCHKDIVTFQSCSESKKIREGQLWWFAKEGSFLIRDSLADWKLNEIKWFEKVE